MDTTLIEGFMFNKLILKYLQKGSLLSLSLIFALTLISTLVIAAGEPALPSQETLSLERAILSAQAKDPWLIGNQHQQDATEAMSTVVGNLPDPKLSFGLANIATDSFDFRQERMTQLKFGVTQMFPRGRSRELKREQLVLLGSRYPHQREDRKAKIGVMAAKLWFDAYKAQESITLIENDRALFEQLADVAQASYSSAVGRTRQQDIVRAQLELTRLDDRLLMLKQQKDVFQQRLSELLNNYQGGAYQNLVVEIPHLASQLPNVQMLRGMLFLKEETVDPQVLYEYLSKHPSVMALDQKIKASKRGIDLAKQNYKPEWGVNVGYGYRADPKVGGERADLFSLGVTLDLPFFTANRQDKQLSAAVSTSAAIETERWMLVRKLMASFKASHSELIRLKQRHALFEEKLLPQMRDQAEASLNAYTNDDGNFAEVVRARIAELNAIIDALGINVDKQKSIIELNYFFISKADEMLGNQRVPSRHSGES
ncbi:MAG: outer membrane protein TolC [Candidatus Azotimanducaceae bacterium]|jgi:outer membrane protein TolC